MNAIETALNDLTPSGLNYAVEFVDRLLKVAKSRRASDIHITPIEPKLLEVRMRVDGTLHVFGRFPSGTETDIVTRLKVLSGLLTYHTDVPQEGRLRDSDTNSSDGGVEVRVSTFPTLYGERVVIRQFLSASEKQEIDQLDLPESELDALKSLLGETAGMIMITGPAGSGKTTTAYACLRYLLRPDVEIRNIVSLEDPIEVTVAGVAQSQVHLANGFDMAKGLRSILRQDPEVIFIGEIRDRETAEIAFQAALTGQLVVTTFHAPSAAAALCRVRDMEIEPYLLRSALLGISHQRLVRKLCECRQVIEQEADLLGLHVQKGFAPGGCEKCNGIGYFGRTPLMEFLRTGEALPRSILDEGDAASIAAFACENGMISLAQRAQAAVESGKTSPTEIRRVLGLTACFPPDKV